MLYGLIEVTLSGTASGRLVLFAWNFPSFSVQQMTSFYIDPGYNVTKKKATFYADSGYSVTKKNQGGLHNSDLFCFWCLTSVFAPVMPLPFL